MPLLFLFVITAIAFVLNYADKGLTFNSHHLGPAAFVAALGIFAVAPRFVARVLIKLLVGAGQFFAYFFALTVLIVVFSLLFIKA